MIEGEIWFSREVVTTLLHSQLHQTEGHQGSELDELEREILRYLVAGETDKQIAKALSLSERTVRYYLKGIYDKLGVNSRVEAVVRALRLGLVG